MQTAWPTIHWALEAVCGLFFCLETEANERRSDEGLNLTHRFLLPSYSLSASVPDSAHGEVAEQYSDGFKARFDEYPGYLLLSEDLLARMRRRIPADTKETKLRTITRICLLLVLFAGCDRQVSTSSLPTSEYSGRLDAALAMKEGTARHNVLVKLAENAAQSGNGDVVLKAIAAVDAGTARDNTCVLCCIALAKQGKTAEATAVAKEIANETARENTLSQIASSDQK